MFFIHFFHFFYDPSGAPWYQGAVWSNVFVILVLAPLGYLWSKTKFWPLNLVHKKLDSLHVKHDAHAEQLRLLHEKHDQLLKEVGRLHRRMDHAPFDVD
jgi:hypothetical protein